jgi:hypothetical protein
MKVKLVSAVRKWAVILNSAGGMRDCCVVRESGGYAFCLSPRDFCRGLKCADQYVLGGIVVNVLYCAIVARFGRGTGCTVRRFLPVKKLTMHF